MLDIIALHAPPRSGKDVVGEYLASHYHAFCMKFASPFKRGLREMGLTDEEIEGPLKDVPSARFNGKAPRHVMENIGGLFREYDPEWWPKQLEKFINLLEEDYHGTNLPRPFVVITDLRHLNEAGWVKRMGGKIVYIHSDGALHLDPAGHESRKMLDASWFDYEIENHYMKGDRNAVKPAIDAVIAEAFGGLYPKQE